MASLCGILSLSRAVLRSKMHAKKGESTTFPSLSQTGAGRCFQFFVGAIFSAAYVEFNGVPRNWVCLRECHLVSLAPHFSHQPARCGIVGPDTCFRHRPASQSGKEPARQPPANEAASQVASQPATSQRGSQPGSQPASQPGRGEATERPGRPDEVEVHVASRPPPLPP